MKILILGAGGQVGSAVIDACSVRGIPFIALKRKDADITNLESLKALANEHKPTHIINCAAYTDVDRAERAPHEAYAINAQGPENLGLLACEFPIHILHISTDYVFDGTKGKPYVETDTPAPLGVYGKSKLEGEERLQSSTPNNCIVRTSWVFGRGGNNFISSALKLLQEKEVIQATKDQINRATFSRDLAFALLDLSCESGLFHFANGGELSRLDIINDFIDEARKREVPFKCQQIEPIPFPVQSIRPQYSVLSTEKVERILGKKLKSWKTVLSEYLDHAI